MAVREKTGLDIEAAVNGAGQILKLAEEVEQLGGDATELKAQTAGLIGQLDRLSAQQQLIQTFERTQAAAAASAAAIEKLGAESAEAGARQRQLQANLSVAQQALSKQRDAVAGLSAEQQRANIVLNESKARYLDLRDQSRAAGKGNEELKAALAAAKVEFDQQRAAVRGLNGDLAAATRVQRDLERAVTADEKAIERQTRTLTDLAGKTDRARAAQQEQTATLQRSGDALRRAGVDTENLASAQQRIRASTVVANQAIGQSRVALDQQRAALKATADEAERAGKRFDGLGRSAKTAIAGFVGIQTARELIQVADAAQLVESRLRLVTNSEAELATAQTGMLAVAQRTRQAYEGTADLFVTIARSAQDLKLSQTALLGVTETIQQAVKVSGASQSSAQAALVQLGQGLASGTLRGEELNSVLEQTPRIARALADGLGIPFGQLRALAKEGKLTSEEVIKALQSQSAAIRAEFDKLAPTVSDNVTQAKNSFQQFISELNQQTGSTSVIGKAVAGIGGIFESLAINLELARKEEERQQAALPKLADVAGESAARIREFAAAQAETSESVKLLDKDLTSLQGKLTALGSDISKAGIGDINKLAVEAQTVYAAAGAAVEALREQFPALANVGVEALAKVDSRFADVLKRVTDTGKVVETLRNEQLRRLGIDAGEVLTGIDDKARDALEAFRGLANDPTASPKLITAAYKELLATLDSREELDGARAALQAAFDAGLISAKELAAGVDQVKLKLSEIPGTAEAANQAIAEALRLQTEQILQDADERLQNEIQRGRESVEQHQQNEADKAEATEESGDRQAQANASVAKFVAEALARNRAEFRALSEEAALAFDSIVKNASKASLIFFFEDIAKGVASLRRIQDDQSARADSLIRQLQDVRTANDAVIRTAIGAAESLRFIDHQRLDNLYAAIDGARQRLDSLRSAAQSTFNSLRDEFDQLKGNQDAIEQRRRDAQRAEIEAQLKAAKAAGDRESIRQLEQSLQLLEQINREKTRIAQQERQQAATPTPSTPAPQTITTVAPSPTKVTRVEFVLPGSNRVISGEFEDDDADALLRLLGQAKAVSAA